MALQLAGEGSPQGGARAATQGSGWLQGVIAVSLQC